MYQVLSMHKMSLTPACIHIYSDRPNSLRFNRQAKTIKVLAMYFMVCCERFRILG